MEHQQQQEKDLKQESLRAERKTIMRHILHDIESMLCSALENDIVTNPFLMIRLATDAYEAHIDASRIGKEAEQAARQAYREKAASGMPVH